MLEDIDPTSSWVVETCPPEFDSDEDMGVGMDFDTQVEALLNADPLVVGPVPSPPVVATGTSSIQPRQRRITRLSQAQRATVLVEDADSEERAVSPSSSEFDLEDIGLSDVSLLAVVIIHVLLWRPFRTSLFMIFVLISISSSCIGICTGCNFDIMDIFMSLL